MKKHIKNNETFSIMSNLQSNYHFKLDFQILDQHKGGKWLIHGIKHFKDDQLQSLELPWRKNTLVGNLNIKHDTKLSEGNMFKPILEENVQGQKPPGRCLSAEAELPSYRKPKFVDQN